MKRLSAELEPRAIERSGDLATADNDKKEEAAARHHSEQAPRASAERSLCYFELGLVGMAIVSPTTGCLEVNRRLCDILGYRRRELMQMTWAALTHPDDLAEDTRNYDRILAGEVDGYLTTRRWIRKDDDAVHTNVSVKCQRHENGSVNYFAAMVEEVTGLDQHAVGVPEAKQAGKPDMQGHAGLAEPTALSGREREVARLIGFRFKLGCKKKQFNRSAH